MTDFLPGGNRRIDRVLAPDFVTALGQLPMPELRGRRAEAEQEEVDLSFLRRLLHGRIDIVRAELRRRTGSPDDSLVDHLAEVLAENLAGQAHGLGRHTAVEPSRVDTHRRRVERLVADVDMTNLGQRTDEELQRALEAYLTEERGVSTQRRAVQAVMDQCSAEIARRYRDGEADVSALLEERP
ncbi:MAG: aerial mycelium formation protein [Actinomycetota bacterium]|nr:aerial mycelium formation protein [Actinomycetota bacterium]